MYYKDVLKEIKRWAQSMGETFLYSDEWELKDSVSNKKNFNEQKEMRKNEIITNDEYLEWLDSFMKTRSRIVSNAVQTDKTITSDDQLRISQLPALFEALYEYAEEHHLKRFWDDYSDYILLKYRNHVYELGGAQILGAYLMKLDEYQNEYADLDRIAINIDKDFVRKRYR